MNNVITFKSITMAVFLLLFYSATITAQPVNSTKKTNATVILSEEEIFANNKEKVVVAYRLSLISMGRAQAKIALALDLKKQADLLTAQANALEADRTRKKLDDKEEKKKFQAFSATSRKANKAIKKKLKKRDVIKKEKSAEFYDASVAYASSLTLLNAFVKEAGPFYKSLADDFKPKSGKKFKFSLRNVQEKVQTGLGVVKKAFGKAGVVIYIGSSSPKTINGHIKTGKDFIAYAKENKIDVPVSTEKALEKFKEPNWSTI